MKKKLIVLSGFALGLAPLAALAQVTTGGATSTCVVGGQNATLFGLFCQVGAFFNAFVPVFIAFGVLYFVWGVVQYVISDEEEAKKKGRDRMIYGIIGLAVIIGLWGLVNLVRNTFGLGNTTNITLPTLPVLVPNQPLGQ